MTKNWSFAKITDILQKKIEVSDRISKSLSQQNLRCPSPQVKSSNGLRIMTVQSFFNKKMPKNMDSRSETQVKIDYAGTEQEVLNLKGHKISQEISSLHFINLYFWAFLV